MIPKKQKAIYAISLAASLIIAIQVIIIAFTGDAACLNKGCEVLESLTTIPPLYYNLLGLSYFQTVFWLFFLLRKQPALSIDWPRILLLAGLAVEGVLLGYQIFVAQTFCSYCLIIFTFVVLLNFLYGRQQIITGTAVVIAINLFFSLLSFDPSLLLTSRKMDLNTGTYGTRTCSNPAKELYLFFSANCPHCKTVIKALEGCNSCKFHFNPIEKLKSLELDGIEANDSYSPEVNRLLLALLEINTIPVLIEKKPSGFSVIKGEKKIISHIEQFCYQTEHLLYFESSEIPEDEDVSVYGEEGECSMTIECDDDEVK